MKMIPVQDAVGMVLCHDITQIIPGLYKGPAFRKGHILQEEDVPRLLNLGKERIYAFELPPGRVHEDEAALRLARAAAGEGLALSGPKEGKVDLLAVRDGLLKIDVEALYKVNEVDQTVFVTLHSNQRVSKDKLVAGTRVIPLTIDEGSIAQVEAVCREHYPLVQVLPFRTLKVGIVVTGSEVYYGRIQDRFSPVVQQKLAAYGCDILGQTNVSDRVDLIVQAIRDFLNEGADLITVTGGMSVDPDDVTPAGIKAAGGQVVTYGVPVLPGAMFMLAYIGQTAVVGLPGCVMYHGTSIFDVILPRLIAGDAIERRDFVRLAHGGLCVHCRDCKYPDCGFGKGA
jgi:molybdenum cofactor synthesis domain-containing protein